MQYQFESKIQKELDRLISIAVNHREGDITQSLFYDVMYKYNVKDIISDCIDYLTDHDVKIVSDDQSIESEEDFASEKPIKPYDTRLIDISPKTQSLDNIISRLKNDEIELMPGFQRRAGLWGNEQKSQLIESLILRIPLPAFYFDGSDNDMWIVIDGLQRLTALKEFFVEKTLRLTGLEFLIDLEGITSDELPRSYMRRIRETQIITYIINPGSPINLKYNIFKRINTGGLELEPQEIRHALNQGIATSLLEKLAGSEQFKEATGYSINTDRMLDREFVLRFLAFYELPLENYTGSIDSFLNEAMDYINKKYDDTYIKSIEAKFFMALETSKQLFGKFAFRRMPDKTKKRPISKALFESWMSILASYSIEDNKVFIQSKDTINEKYMKLFLTDKEFVESIRSTKTLSISRRIERIKTILEECLQNDNKD